MNRVLLALIFSGLSMFIAMNAVQAETTKSSKENGANSNDGIAKCIYTPQADAQSSSLPSESLGFRFSIENNNNNEVAVDIFSLNEKLQPIKLVGHAELISGLTQASSGTATVTAAQLLSNLELAEDSPFDFALSSSDNLQSSGDSDGRYSVIATTVTTFTAKTYSEVPLKCRLGKIVTKNQNSSGLR